MMLQMYLGTNMRLFSQVTCGLCSLSVMKQYRPESAGLTFIWNASLSTSLPARTRRTISAGRRVCVVGAGVAGLSSASHLLANGQQVTVLEATAHIGGTWRYDPRVGLDEYGRPIHTSMYKNLRSNLARQLMELPGFPLPPGTPSFVSATVYYQYLLDYADHFRLGDFIKLLHEVTQISRQGDVWRVMHRHVPSGQTHEEEYDYVLVCIGHYSKPRLPSIPGESIFKGSIIHSHDYRSPDVLSNRRVMVLGGGASGLDMVTILTRHGNQVLHSHHATNIKTPFPDNYTRKPDVFKFTEHGVHFQDGSYEDVDDVIYATGYELNFPFLHASTGLTVRSDHLAPLHHSVVNVAQPSLLVVGLTDRGCSILTIITQARYAAAVVSGQARLPSQQKMYEEWKRQADDIIAKGKKLSELHTVNPGSEDLKYHNDLTSEANIPAVPPVLPALCAENKQARLDNFYTFREDEYTVLNDERFIRVPSHQTEKCREGAPPSEL